MAKTAPVRDIDRGLKAMLRRFATGVQEITVGIHSQDGDVPKKGADGGDTTLLDVAAAHEFGLGVPRRSFIANWQDENAERHKKQIEAMAKAIIRGTVPSAEVAAERLANLWVGEIQKRIVAGIPPQLSEATVKRKKSSTPLIDTGQLRSSIAYAVNGKLHPSQAFENATKERVKAEKKARKQATRERKKALKKAFTEAKKTAKGALKQTLRDMQRAKARLGKAANKARKSKKTRKAPKKA